MENKTLFSRWADSVAGVFAVLALAMVAATLGASAATITWNAPQAIAGTSDVSVQGAYFGSWAPYDSTSLQYPVNGVTFTGTDLGVTSSGFYSGGALFGPDLNTPDDDYDDLLQYGIYSTGTAASFTINGTGTAPLTVGHQYLIQFWVNDARNLGVTRTETVNASATLNFPSNGSGMGQYVIGYFTADSSSQVVNLAGSQIGGSGIVQVNLLQLRDLSAPPGNGIATPATLSVGQTSVISVTATSGSGLPIASVTVDASSIGIPSPVALSSTGGIVYTGTVTVGAGTIYGSQVLMATVTDSGSNQTRVNVPVFLPTPAYYKTPADSLAAWQASRFGFFVCWGPFSLMGGEDSWSRANTNPACPNGGSIPAATYDNLYTQFNPTNFNATQWVATAKAAGYKYIVFTAKNCDGFLCWNSNVSSYNIMNSPFHRDVCGELAAAAHAAGMKIGWYFSPMDWKDPRFRTSQNPAWVKDMQAELRELLTNYGKIDVLWFDCDGGSIVYDQTNTYAMCRSLQPDIVIDNRLDIATTAEWEPNAQTIGPWADFKTPEQTIGASDYQNPWETCMTLGTQWGWKSGDAYKSTQTALTDLLLCAGGDGNYLLDIGPDSTGAFDPGAVANVTGVGTWLAQYGQSVYDTRGGPYQPGSNFASTRSGNTIYLHLFPPQPYVILPPLPVNVLSATVLTGGSAAVVQTANSVVLSLSATAAANAETTIQLNLSSSAMNIPIMASGTLSASSPIVTTWQTPRTIAGSSDVNTEGTPVIAMQAATGSDTVNGVAFTSTANTQNGVTCTLAGSFNYNGTVFMSTKMLSGTNAAAYEAALEGAWYGTGTSPLTLGFSGLTPGDTYLFQLWVNDFRQLSSARTETVTSMLGTDYYPPTLDFLTGDGANPGSGTGQYVIGTFTATGTSAGFTLTGNQLAQINAFQVRDITAFPLGLTWNNGASTMNWNGSDTNWSGSAWINAPLASATFGATGAGPVNLTGPITASSITFNSAGYTLSGGTLALTGSQAIVNNADAAIGTPFVSGGLNKSGAGTLTLTGSNTFTGPVAVNGGTLMVNGQTAAASGIAVAAGACLSGSGTVAAVTVNGGAALAPGGTGAPGMLSMGALSLNAGSLATFRLGTASDSVNVSGDLALSGTICLADTGSAIGGTYTLFTYSGALSGTPVLVAPAGFAATLVTSTAGQVNVHLAANTFGTWQRSYFTAQQIANPLIGGATAIPAGDGVSNLLKYALGLNPNLPCNAPGVLSQQSGATWALTYQRPANRSDIVYSVQVSTDLSSWTASGVTMSETGAGDPQTWQGTYVPGQAPKLFFRLCITQQ